MFEQGIVDEVKTFSARHLVQVSAAECATNVQHSQHLTSKDVRRLLEHCGFNVKAWPPVMAALGFGELLLAVQGVLSVGEAAGLVLRRTLQYAKRQRTWLRHQLPAPGRTPHAHIVQVETFSSTSQALAEMNAHRPGLTTA
jgi:tRNA dimethylallyltransferase